MVSGSLAIISNQYEKTVLGVTGDLQGYAAIMGEVKQMIAKELTSVTTALASLTHNMSLIMDKEWALPSCKALEEIMTNIQHELKLLELQTDALDSHDLENTMLFYPMIQDTWKEHVEVHRIWPPIPNPNPNPNPNPDWRS